MMKKLQLFFIALLITTATFAQPPRGRENMDPAKRSAKMIEMLEEKMELNSNEKESLTAIFTSEMEQMKEAHESGTRPSREEMQALRKESNKKVKAVLGEERFEIYKEMQEEQRGKRQDRARERNNDNEEERGEW